MELGSGNLGVELGSGGNLGVGNLGVELGSGVKPKHLTFETHETTRRIAD
jgi:hypothetical protein